MEWFIQVQASCYRGLSGSRGKEVVIVKCSSRKNPHLPEGSGVGEDANFKNLPCVMGYLLEEHNYNFLLYRTSLCHSKFIFWLELLENGIHFYIGSWILSLRHNHWHANRV